MCVPHDHQCPDLNNFCRYLSYVSYLKHLMYIFIFYNYILTAERTALTAPVRVWKKSSRNFPFYFVTGFHVTVATLCIVRSEIVVCSSAVRTVPWRSHCQEGQNVNSSFFVANIGIQNYEYLHGCFKFYI